MPDSPDDFTTWTRTNGAPIRFSRAQWTRASFVSQRQEQGFYRFGEVWKRNTPDAFGNDYFMVCVAQVPTPASVGRMLDADKGLSPGDAIVRYVALAMDVKDRYAQDDEWGDLEDVLSSLKAHTSPWLAQQLAATLPVKTV